MWFLVRSRRLRHRAGACFRRSVSLPGFNPPNFSEVRFVDAKSGLGAPEADRSEHG